jgi:hypothetical protein
MKSTGDTSKLCSKWVETLDEKKKSPGYIYESVQGCHHFVSSDHEKLGADLCLVFHQVLVKSLKEPEEIQSIIRKHMAKIQDKLFKHNSKQEEVRAQSMSPAKIKRDPQSTIQPGGIVANNYNQLNSASKVLNK